MYSLLTHLTPAGGSLAMAATWGANCLSGTRLWATKGADSVLYALLACHVVVDPYRKFVWLFDVELNSLGYDFHSI